MRELGNSPRGVSDGGAKPRGTADWDAVCADARKTPPKRVRGVLANRLRTAETPNLAAQGQSVSRKTVAEVPLTELSFWEGSHLRRRNIEYPPQAIPARAMA